MCLEAMDTRSKHTRGDCLRKNMRPASKLRWKLLRVSTVMEGEEAADKALNLPCRTTATKTTTTNRRHPCREQRRTQRAKLSKILGEMGRNDKLNNIIKNKRKKEKEAAAACIRHHPAAGAMAPENTTQYLMSNVYEDLKNNDTHAAPATHESSSQLYGESLSPSSVYSALDRGYESCLAFQQRDFDALFDLW